MSLDVLLDTNAVSEISRRKNARLLQRVSEHLRAGGKLATSTITVFEIVRGLWVKNRRQEAQSFLVSMQNWEVFVFDTDAAEIAGRIESELRLNGTPLELADILIAAVAVANRRVLITGNTRHFEQVRALGFSLALEDWSTPPASPSSPLRARRSLEPGTTKTRGAHLGWRERLGFRSNLRDFLRATEDSNL